MAVLHSGYNLPFPRIFAFLGHLKSGVDIGQDYGVTQWGDIVILACNTNRFQVVKPSKEKNVFKLILLRIYSGGCQAWALHWQKPPCRTWRSRG